MHDQKSKVHFALPPGIHEAIDAAKKGDSFQWGYLYSVAAVCLKAGHAIPDPLGTIVAERLSAMGDFLTQPKIGDLQRLVDLVAPYPGPRKMGPRKRVDRIELAAQAAQDLLDLDDSYGRRKLVTAWAASVAGVSSESVNKKMDANRKGTRQTRGKSSETGP